VLLSGKTEAKNADVLSEAPGTAVSKIGLELHRVWAHAELSKIRLNNETRFTGAPCRSSDPVRGTMIEIEKPDKKGRTETISDNNSGLWKLSILLSVETCAEA